jgi:hypothetical protein
MFAAARVQRFDWPTSLPTTAIDEIGRKLHVGTTTEIPEVTVTIEAFNVNHNIDAYMTGYTPGTFPTVSGVSITDLKGIDVVGQIRDATTAAIVNALYVKRGIVSGMDATFGVRDNSSVTYTITASSKKEFKNPVFSDGFTVSGAQTNLYLTYTPTYLPLTSGYIINAGRVTAAGAQTYLDEGTDYTVTGTNVQLLADGTTGDYVWFTYCSAQSATFQPLDDVSAAAIQGKYVPVAISVNNIPRAQSASIRASMEVERIFELGGLGKPVGTEIGIPSVTGDLSVLKTDNELLNILTGQSSTADEADLEYQANNLSLKIQLKDPANPTKVVKTYYVPSITITQENDESTVNQSMNETFSWESKTGELFIASGAGPW